MRTVLTRFLPACALALALAAGVGCRPRETAGPLPYAVALARAEGATGTRIVVPPGTLVVLDGTESGAAGQASPRFGWRWRQTAGPRVRLARNDLSQVECRLDTEGRHVFELIVTLGSAMSTPASVEVEVRRGAAISSAGTTSFTAMRPARPHGGGADFALLESDLGELIRVFGAKTGITLRTDIDWLRPEAFKDRPLTLMARDVPPQVALELAARLAGGSCLRDGKDSALLTSGLGWLRRERETAHFYLLPGGLIKPGGDGRDLEELLKSSCRAVLLACPGTSVTYEAQRGGVQVVGPESMHRRVRDVIAALAAGGAAPPDSPSGSADERLRDSTLGQPLEIRLMGASLSQTALDLGRVLGVPVAWEEPASNAERGPAPVISIDSRGRPASEVLADVTRQGGFRGFSWITGGAIWLYRTEPRAGSAEPLWMRAEARSYPAGWLEQRNVLPGAFILSAKKRVSPDSWADPAAVIVYYKTTDRLLVINSPEAHDALVRLMHELTAKPQN